MDKEKRKRLRTYYERNNDVQELLTYVEGLEALVDSYERHIKDIELRCECEIVRGGIPETVLGYAKNPQCPIHGNPGPKCRYCGMPVDVMYVTHSSEVPISECPKPLGGPHYSVDDVGIVEVLPTHHEDGDT